ncbi:MAG: peptidoglycan-binding protein [Clostridia bacterium]|nr:peptidoglycan-binding protein [Clostridia bacterium]
MAFYDINNEKNFILQIQRMLRDIRYLSYDDASQGVTGIYDPATRHAIMRFQREMGLSPTGRVDIETWEILNSSHSSALYDASVPRAVHIFPMYSDYVILPDSQDTIVYVLQHMLNEITVNDESSGYIEMTGIYDKPTENAVMKFKRRNLLGTSPDVDVTTLNRIFDEYEVLISSSR